MSDAKAIPKCEDCGNEIDAGHRRTRCKHCGKLVCGWCFNHVHGKQSRDAAYAMKSKRKEDN